MIQEADKKIQEFTDLLAWQEAHKLLLFIYRETKNFPKEEMFGLASQMQRAAISITSNIAEGFGRQGYKEKIQFYYLAHGSLTELKINLLLHVTWGIFLSKILVQSKLSLQLLINCYKVC